MRIQLKQPEIVGALKQYIAKQGIDLNGKSVSITFTAGRRNTGLSADINIADDDDLPQVNEVAEPKPSLAMVKPPKVEVPPPPDIRDEPVDDGEAPSPKATATTSLFA